MQFARGPRHQASAALTEAQQRQLTTDLVWLVEQTVTLPDGTTETVLVPQVYLLVREGDLKGDRMPLTSGCRASTFPG
ncbi:hypothetical protein [Achromobacter marplatensis]|uniref:hypothetical protein n=1 Tax=Achromobacter marplatensis TaxID=470868 RepID=UPI0039F6857B